MSRTPWERKAPDHYLVQGDAGRTVTDQLKDGNGNPVDLSSGSPTVKYLLTLKGGTTPKVNAAATIVTPASGIVRYTYVSGDIDTAGTFIEEWQVTTGGNPVTYPEPTPHKVRVREQLGS
jgi:hypothetical protein